MPGSQPVSKPSQVLGERPLPAPCWRSLHLFLDAEAGTATRVGDQVLLELVKPLLRLVKDDVERCFFIRYSVPGSHLRLRLESAAALNVPVHDLLSSELALEAAREDQLGVFFPSALEGLRHVRYVDYEPETARYGGLHGVRVAERLFCASSDLVLELLDGADDAGTRSARALLAMVVQMHALSDGFSDGPEPSALVRAYKDAVVRHLGRGDDAGAGSARWQQFFDARCGRQSATLAHAVRSLWQALESGQVPAPFEPCHRSFEQGRRKLGQLVDAGLLGSERGPFESLEQALLHLTPSYLHMTSNRLGIDLLEEAFLAHLAQGLLWPERRLTHNVA